MHPAEIEEVLASFKILVDTREQPTARAKKRYERFGCPHERVALSFGDYAANAKLPNGEWIHDIRKTVVPKCAIERKMALSELAYCFCQGRKRFIAEFERAKENGARIYLLVENASWAALFLGRYRSKMSPVAFSASVITFMVRYNLNLIFCNENETPRLIRDILYRDLKERLERGEYDT